MDPEALFGDTPENSVLLDESEYDAIMTALEDAGVEDPDMVATTVQLFERASLVMKILAMLVSGDAKIAGIDENGTPSFGLVDQPTEEDDDDEGEEWKRGEISGLN